MPDIRRWQTLTDRLLVLLLILAAWQAGSCLVGAYWLSSPWAVAGALRGADAGTAS